MTFIIVVLALSLIYTGGHIHDQYASSSDGPEIAVSLILALLQLIAVAVLFHKAAG